MDPRRPGTARGRNRRAESDGGQALPRGYTYEFSGLSYEEIKAGSTDGIHIIFSITFVFLFLAALYESWSVPFSVMLPVPISAFGAILMLVCIPRLTNNVLRTDRAHHAYRAVGQECHTHRGVRKKCGSTGRGTDTVHAGGGQAQAPADHHDSLAFILGVLPLAFATGAAAVARNRSGSRSRGNARGFHARHTDRPGSFRHVTRLFVRQKGACVLQAIMRTDGTGKKDREAEDRSRTGV